MGRGLYHAALAASVGLGLLVALVPASSPAATSGRFSLHGTVSRVVDGDTLDVVLTSGRRERVRLIGIDTPERGVCYSTAATSRARRLALAKRIVLKGDGTQHTRDRYGRLLAYVWLPGGKDLGFQLIAGGFGKVYVYHGAFERLAAYRRAERSARTATAGQWQACGAGATVPPPPSPPTLASSCHPSYTPCLPVVADLDCPDIRELGVAPVRVLGSDPYRLDGDDDGLGCE
jgi:endonuclease YncB( thermonuclease family)